MNSVPVTLTNSIPQTSKFQLYIQLTQSLFQQEFLMMLLCVKANEDTLGKQTNRQVRPLTSESYQIDMIAVQMEEQG